MQSVKQSKGTVKVQEQKYAQKLRAISATVINTGKQVEHKMDIRRNSSVNIYSLSHLPEIASVKFPKLKTWKENCNDQPSFI